MSLATGLLPVAQIFEFGLEELERLPPKPADFELQPASAREELNSPQREWSWFPQAWYELL